MYCTLLLLLCLGSDDLLNQPAQHDRLEMSDGTLLIGKILQLEDDQYHVAVEGIGKIKVSAENVISVTILTTETLVTDAGENLAGPLQLTAGTWTVNNPLGERAIPQQRVVAINPTPVLAPTSTQKATITLNGSQTTGNTRTASAVMNLDYTFRYLTHRFVSKVDWTYGEDEAIVTKRSTGAEIKYDFFPEDNWYLYTSFSARNDAFADLALRTTAGIGAGIQILDTEHIDWSEESGISALNEDFVLADDETTSTLRIAGRAEWTLKEEIFEAFHDHTLYIALDDPDKILAQGRLGIRTRIVGGLSLNAQMNVRHNSQPPPEVEQDDVEILLGLGYSTTF
ncbi:MAG: DUF481 domain-containing protein [Planctomycetota bacterium]|nr:DUF481 domain-containing protein [Planctomycetota bacterium]